MKKRKIQITGRVVFPLQVGSRAFLETEHGQLLTSCVVKMKRKSGNKLVFETENSIYHLFVKRQTGNVRCAV